MKSTNGEILFKKFEIINCVKKDEFSAVYYANHVYLEKTVFIKVLNTDAIPDQTIVSRFKLEAKILAKLEHPNIIKVYDFGMFDNYFYISFEFFESQNLREFLKNKKVTDDLSLEIFIQIVQGLDYAHKQKIIHRDIKPENILIDKNNIVKITDFGLAVDIFDNMQTKKYSVVGTPAYMSPEQVIGEKITTQSDLFSLGLTALEIFGFKNPFFGNDAGETINKIISYDQDEYKNLLNEIPEKHKHFFQGLLAVNPENRFDSCSKILQILGTDVETYETESIEKKSTKWIFLAVVFIAAIGVSYLVFFTETPPESIINKKVEERQSRETVNSDSADFDQNMDSLKLTVIESEDVPQKNNFDDKLPEESPSEINNSAPKIIERSKLFVECYPWGKIYLNDKFIDTTPLNDNLEVEPGKYTMKIIHPSYPVFEDSISLLPGKRSFVNVNLDTLFGFLNCYVFPWGKVIINGEEKGVTPLESPIILEEGIHNLRIINENFSPFSTKISIAKRDTLTVKINLPEMNMK